MKILTIATPKENVKGLGCLNGLSCPECNSPLVDTLKEVNTDRKLNDCLCPMCEWEGKYNKFTKTIK